MFQYKSEEELSKMTSAERDIYAQKKREHEADLQSKAISLAVEALKNNMPAEIKTELDNQLSSMKVLKGISKEHYDDLVEAVNQLKENNGAVAKGEQNFFNIVEKALVDAMPQIKALRDKEENRGKEVVLTIKAPAVMNSGNVTANASGQNTPISYVYNQVTDFAQDVRTDEYIINFVDNGNTDKPTIPYMDKLPTQGTMQITNEGQLKPLISVSFQLAYSNAFKIAGRSKVSEESLDDIPYLMGVIRGELMYEHDIAQQAAIFAKVAAIAPGFVAGGMAASTTSPSNFDALRAAIYAIKIASKGRYIPNAALVNSSDAYNMGATKDTTGQYVFPPFVLPDGTRVAGVQVIETNDTDNVPVGTFVVGDWKRLKRRVYKQFTVRIGQGINTGLDGAATVQSDFESNMYTMIGESRQHLWIYTNEKVAFVKATFASVKTAIAAA